MIYHELVSVRSRNNSPYERRSKVRTTVTDLSAETRSNNNHNSINITTQFTTFLSEFKNMFSQILNQISMVISTLSTAINILTR
jgi:hypothetical protein